MATSLSMDCSDFLEFQDSLQKARKIDDQIIYALNSVIPTESFKEMIDPSTTCRELHQQISNVHEKRESSIIRFRDAARQEIDELKKQRTNNPDDVALKNNLQKVQNMLKRLESELDIENVLKNRTCKVFNEKCRFFYKNPSVKE